MPNFAALDTVIQDLCDSQKLGNRAIPNGFAVIAYDADGTCLYCKNASSEFDLDAPNPMASCSKMISPLVLLQMQERGVLNIDDPVPQVPNMILDKILVDYRDGQPVFQDAVAPTWKQLANHTSGVAYAFETTSELLCKYLGIAWPPRAGDPATYSKRSYSGPLLYSPGQEYRYSPGLGVAGLVLEHMTAKTLDEHFQEGICQPLGIVNSTFRCPADNRTVWPGKSIRMDPDSPWEDHTIVIRAPFDAGDGSLHSSANDFSRMLLEVLKAISGKPNVLFQSSGTAQLLAQDGMTAAAKDVLYRDIGPRWANRPIAKDWSREDWHFGLGYLVNHKDLSSGRRAGSLMWDGLFGSYGVVDPKSGICLCIYMLVDNAVEPSVRAVHDTVEATFYKCLNC